MIGKDEQRGTYYVQYKFKDNLGKWHTTRKRGFKKKADAVKYESSIKLDEDNNFNTAGNITFKELEERYCDSNQLSKEQRSRRDVALKLRFSKYYDKPIKNISKYQLDEWRNNLVNDETYSTSTKNATISYVKSVFKYASDVYNIQNNASFLKRCKQTNEEVMKEKAVWTVEEFNKFSDCIEYPLFKIFFNVLFWTGMRRGEAMALQKSDFDGKGFIVNKQITDYINGLKPTKTRNSRYVLLPDNLIPQIKDVIDKTKDGNFIFGGERSLSIVSIRKVFKDAKKKAGLEDSGVTIHGLRHSHATWLINNGVNIVAVSKRLGHSDINVTLKEYTHLLENTDKEMMNKINTIGNVKCD